MHTPQTMTITLHEAMDIQAICFFAAQHYDLQAGHYPHGEPLRRHYEKRAEVYRQQAEKYQQWIQVSISPKWTAHLEAVAEHADQSRWSI